ncbi:MAG: DNA-3-methyladenine glycosylase [Actinomycetia bacterium]|nr:DNA-3-methyladenine glycosylase [Actinomycetes bacterium]
MEYKKNILDRGFYSRDTSKVARDLLGKVLVKKSGRTAASGIIVETEAYYGPGDPASHAFRGSTPRSSIMFGKAGIAYVYLCYGVYWLLNIVTGEEGVPGAILIRGLKPLDGIEEMQKRRNISCGRHKLTDGPGKLTIAMDIGYSDNGKDVADPKSDIYILENSPPDESFIIKNTERIGITNGKDRLLRYIAIGL